ncbi:hypothetical protein [Allosalinactinospora lopnorensis]|uniref:hypothetical protein n=1 Tax=Allosalinactinospora lopnorensis TaxID=1352348 RepID=UPI000623BF1D|nr:hypothetical protein [Allosalinactinospora lopnorensis]
MVQVDVFWSYAIGAGFALAAGERPRAEMTGLPPEGEGGGDVLRNPHFTASVLFFAVVFAPSGAWLLWAFPGWETMHAASGHAAIPAWVVAAFAATNTALGAAGFVATRRLVRLGRNRLAALQFLGGYFGFFLILVHGWDGTGYRRFLSSTAADLAAWESGAPLANAAEWLSSGVALTLYGMGAVMLPLMLGMMARWHNAERRRAGIRSSASTASAFIARVLVYVFGIALGAAVLTSALIHHIGWLGGLAVSGTLAAASCLPRRGVLAWVGDRF